jgi:hypothetical protein
MSRLMSLYIPALVALLIGTLATVVLGLGLVEVRGGLAAAGASGMAFVIAVSLLGISAIDQTSARLLFGEARKGSARAIASRPLRFSTAVLQMYTRPFVPIAVLSAGLGLLISILARGLLPEYSVSVLGGIRYGGSELCMTGLLVVSSVVTAWFGRRSAAVGCAVGTVAATLIAEAVFRDDFSLLYSLTAWVGGLVAVVLLVLMVSFLRARYRAG